MNTDEVIRVKTVDEAVVAIHQYLIVNTVCPIITNGPNFTACHPNCVCFSLKTTAAFEHHPAFHRAKCHHKSVDRWIGPRVIVAQETCCLCEELKTPAECIPVGATENPICKDCDRKGKSHDTRCCECEEYKTPDEMATSGGKNNICHECAERLS